MNDSVKTRTAARTLEKIQLENNSYQNSLSSSVSTNNHSKTENLRDIITA